MSQTETKQKRSLKWIPQRTCLGCRKKKNKTDLIRVVKTSDGVIRVDQAMKLDGRGAYICRNEKCLTRALKSKALSRTLKTEIPAEVRELLEKEVLS